MLAGAFTAAAVTFYAHSPWVGLGAAGLAGALVASVLAIVCIRFKANEVVAGTGINILFLGLPGVLSGALFLSAGGYHHHLGTNTWSRGPSAADDEARLLAWDLVLPTRDDADAVAISVQEHGGAPSMIDNGWIVKDPWGTPVRVVV